MYKTGLVRRRRELLALEGWYDVGPYKFKLSCRFKDILRASEFNGKTCHFISCFRRGGLVNDQLHRRCLDQDWAIIYTPDKHGNFMGRCFVHLDEKGRLVIDRVYGNRLKIDDIILKMNKISECGASLLDTYLEAI